MKKDQHKENDSHQKKHDKEHGYQAYELSDQELISVNGLWQERVYGFFVDLFGNEGSSYEDSHQRPEEGKRGQADVFNDLYFIPGCEDGKEPGEKKTYGCKEFETEWSFPIMDDGGGSIVCDYVRRIY